VVVKFIFEGNSRGAWFRTEAAKELCKDALFHLHELHIGIAEGEHVHPVVFGPSCVATYRDGGDVPAGSHRWQLEIVQMQSAAEDTET
jgi:hypothetical protein